ncbi:ribosomal protein S15 [Kwoniella heveanensis CBS 569]|nr:ribosomal protein S15 [Kwoniella heveanensis CBS 569]
MSRPLTTFTTSLRTSLPSSSSFLPSSVAGPSRLRLQQFSTTSPTQASKRKLLAKRRKAANLALQSSRIVPPESIDPVLGRVHYRQPSSRSSGPAPPEPTNKWEGCRLDRILLNYEQIAYSNPPDYAAGERPKHLLPGISQADADLLLGALPHASAELKYSSGSGSARQTQHGSASATFTSSSGTGVEEDQSKQSEMLMRILDLRNASKDAIAILNRQRVIDEFGAGKDTGSSSVQAALLTAKIHNLLSHTTSNPKDTSNKRSLRLLVQQRARHLKYLKRTKGEDVYDRLLADLGLERGAVEGELRMAF